jgi:hypothetical protein
MVDVPSLVKAAQGGDVVGNLAQQFGLSPEQAKAAVDSLSPAVAQSLQKQAEADPALGTLADHLNDPAHQQAYADPAAAQSPEAADKGADLLGKLFGETGVVELLDSISKDTGIDADKVKALAATYASVVMGGVAKAANESGLSELWTKVSDTVSEAVSDVSEAVSEAVSDASEAVSKLVEPQAPATPATPAAPEATPAAPADRAPKERIGLGGVVSKLINPIFDVLAKGLFKKN